MCLHNKCFHAKYDQHKSTKPACIFSLLDNCAEWNNQCPTGTKLAKEIPCPGTISDCSPEICCAGVFWVTLSGQTQGLVVYLESVASSRRSKSWWYVVCNSGWYFVTDEVILRNQLYKFHCPIPKWCRVLKRTHLLPINRTCRQIISLSARHHSSPDVDWH